MGRIVGEIEYFDDYFRAHLSDGSIRIGLIDCAAISYPTNHKLHAIASSIKPEEFEQFFDENYSATRRMQ